MHEHLPFKILITVPSLVVVVVVSLLLGYDLVAAGAAGALAGYLGKLNGKT